MRHIKKWIITVVFIILINIGLVFFWGSQNKYIALYNITAMTLDIMLTPSVIILLLCFFYGSGFLKD